MELWNLGVFLNILHLIHLWGTSGVQVEEFHAKVLRAWLSDYGINGFGNPSEFGWFAHYGVGQSTFIANK